MLIWWHKTCTEKAIFPFPFTMNGIWSWWKFSFRFWAKWKSIWFKIERKTVTTIISHSIWKEIELQFSQWSGIIHPASGTKQRPDVILGAPSTLREILCRKCIVEIIPSYHREITSINGYILCKNICWQTILFSKYFWKGFIQRASQWLVLKSYFRSKYIPKFDPKICSVQIEDK